MSENGTGNPVPSDALLAQQIIDAISIAGHLSKDMREGEAPVAWVKRVVQERETARSAFREIVALGQCTVDVTHLRLTDCQNVAIRWLTANTTDQRSAAQGETK